MSMRWIGTLGWSLMITAALTAQTTHPDLTIEAQTPTGFTLVWNNTTAEQMGLALGKTPDLELGTQWNPLKSTTTTKAVATGLEAATFYYARPLAVTDGDTVVGPLGYYSTGSRSTGTIHVLFNQGIDASYSTGASPLVLSGGVNIENAIIAQIDQAQYTIDVAVFNTTRNLIVAALTRAHNRGVRVRFLANQGSFTSNAALNPAPAFPLAYVNANDLMHNKFVAIDAQSVDSSWLWTGSCNWTYTDMYTNYNNIVLIQDQALVRAYEQEFEEMWGSSGRNFNAAASRVGNRKTNNTPGTFNVGGRTIELYFSPSDGTTTAIERSLYSATNDLEFALLTFTRNELGTAVRDEHRAGVWEHGLIENINDPGSEYNWLRNNGVNVLEDRNSTALHHKYAIVDAGSPSSDPLVITGSHNWTTAAEDRNDENTLIIHDATIANLYLQEFALRWCEAKGNINCSLPFSRATSTDQLPSAPEAAQLYPNPSSGQCTLSWPLSNLKDRQLQVYTTTGQLVQTQILSEEAHCTWTLPDLPNGMYVVVVQHSAGLWQQPLMLLR